MTRGWLVCLALCLGVQAASAQPLVWRAPVGCPGEAEIRARIERRLGMPIDDSGVHGVEITISREAGGFVAEIDARALTVANDVRTLRSTRCDALANAVAVIVARLASEAGHAGPEHATSPQESSLISDLTAADMDDPVLALHDRREPTPRFPSRAAPPTWGGGMHLLALSGVGALPELNLGGEIAGYVRHHRHFAELAAGRWVPQYARFQQGAPAGVEVSLDVVTLRAGWGPHELPLRTWVMAELGRIRGTGIAVEEPRSASSRWSALGGGFGVAWPMSPLARLIGTIELAFPLESARFMLRSGAYLYEPSPAAARCSVGLEVGWK